MKGCDIQGKYLPMTDSGFELDLLFIKLKINYWLAFWTVFTPSVALVLALIINHPPFQPNRINYKTQEAYDSAIEGWQYELDQWEYLRPLLPKDRPDESGQSSS